MAAPGRTVQVEIFGDKELMRKMRQAGVELKNWTSELKSSGSFLRSFYSRDVFDSAGSAIGERWAPLKASTIAAKGNSRILVDSGKMRNSFRWNSSSTVGALTNPTEYLPYHQFGTRKMPQRVVVKVTDRIAREVGEIFSKGLVRRLRSLF
jgi:phage gpG-like protein